jgi:hypothetical protein
MQFNPMAPARLQAHFGQQTAEEIAFVGASEASRFPNALSEALTEGCPQIGQIQSSCWDVIERQGATGIGVPSRGEDRAFQRSVA